MEQLETLRPPVAAPQAAASQHFGTALRGYERRQVDEHVQLLTEELNDVRVRTVDIERRWRSAEDHADATADELRALRAKQHHGTDQTPEDGFGYRAEKLLRMAEHEANEVRTKAAPDTTQMIEQARADAEKHRHQDSDIGGRRAAENERPQLESNSTTRG